MLSNSYSRSFRLTTQWSRRVETHYPFQAHCTRGSLWSLAIQSESNEAQFYLALVVNWVEPTAFPDAWRHMAKSTRSRIWSPRNNNPRHMRKCEDKRCISKLLPSKRSHSPRRVASRNRRHWSLRTTSLFSCAYNGRPLSGCVQLYREKNEPLG